MILLDKQNGLYVIGSRVVEHNKATGRTVDGWKIFKIVERGGSAAIGIRRDCPHIEKQGRCNEDWCPGFYNKWVAPSALGLRAVDDDRCPTP